MNKIVKVLTVILLCAFALIGCSKESSKNVKTYNTEPTSALGVFIDEWENKLEKINFKEKYPKYFYSFSNDDIFNGITITNYDTKKITSASDEIQESIEYGNIYGDLNSEMYIQISVLNNDKDYSVNINYKTGEYQDESGEFFLDQDKNHYINSKISMIKEIIE